MLRTSFPAFCLACLGCAWLFAANEQSETGFLCLFCPARPSPAASPLAQQPKYNRKTGAALHHCRMHTCMHARKLAHSALGAVSCFVGCFICTLVSNAHTPTRSRNHLDTICSHTHPKPKLRDGGALALFQNAHSLAAVTPSLVFGDVCRASHTHPFCYEVSLGRQWKRTGASFAH